MNSFHTSAVERLVKRFVTSRVLHYVHGLPLGRETELRYLETHLTDHCNLNCKGCGHLSPLSSRKFTDLQTFQRDMIRLRELFSNIRVFRLMGGEPLLHPHVSDFLTAARTIFPRSDIRLVTNGVLLDRMPPSFWERCNRENVVIDVTLYPIRLDLERIKALAADSRVPLNFSELRTHFLKVRRNLNGDSEIEATFRACRQRGYCPYLEDGRIYGCTAPAFAHFLSERFQENLVISENDFICIYDKVTRRKISQYLESPIPFCRYCTTQVTRFEWAVSKLKREEWLG